ncbi:hypothetical protein EDI_290580 [Entamoeba dispar SAW760]|uniref:Uncharacterized protein n=1 Tax=Entamoeba dispar (strain ATCC PRA-260 / SAW760) TaxID=370354 RepID=B0EIH5_ENTDS|nr:uncharacterized protein EDI_290580 [Entamoeba dispar SAW760]EDR25667.1 hypothetical protein EDI_290580 [Entamoeba dispar SAW760]|eukprot:EDR25667.1 hypothetical protein EDI_290580 [Entamoeba dispar SAW760]
MSSLSTTQTSFVKIKPVDPKYLKYSIPSDLPYYPFGKDLKALPISVFNLPFSKHSEIPEFECYGGKYDKFTLEEITKRVPIPISKIVKCQLCDFNDIDSICNGLIKENINSLEYLHRTNQLDSSIKFASINKELVLQILQFYRNELEVIITPSLSGAIRMLAEEKGDDLYIFFEELDVYNIYAIFVILWNQETSKKITKLCIEKSFGVQILDYYKKTSDEKTKSICLQTLLLVLFRTDNPCGITKDMSIQFIASLIQQTVSLPKLLCNFSYCIVYLLTSFYPVLLSIFECTQFDTIVSIVSFCPTALCVLKKIKKSCYKIHNIVDPTPGFRILLGHYFKHTTQLYLIKDQVLDLVNNICSYSPYPYNYESEILYGMCYLLHGLIKTQWSEVENKQDIFESILKFVIPQINRSCDSSYCDQTKGTFCSKSRRLLFKCLLMIISQSEDLTEYQITKKFLTNIYNNEDSLAIENNHPQLSCYYEKGYSNVYECLIHSKYIQNIIFKGGIDKTNLGKITKYLYGYNTTVLINDTMKLNVNEILDSVIQNIDSTDICLVNDNSFVDSTIYETNKPVVILCLNIFKEGQIITTNKSFRVVFENSDREVYRLVSGIFIKEFHEKNECIILKKINEEQFKLNSKPVNRSKTVLGLKELLIMSEGNNILGNEREALIPVILVYEKDNWDHGEMPGIEQVLNESVCIRDIKGLKYSTWLISDLNTALFDIELEIWKRTKSILSFKSPLKLRKLLLSLPEEYQKSIIFHIFCTISNFIYKSSKPNVSSHIKKLTYLFIQLIDSDEKFLRLTLSEYNKLSNFKELTYSENSYFFQSFLITLYVKLSYYTSSYSEQCYLQFLNSLQMINKFDINYQTASAFNTIISGLVLSNPEYYPFFLKTNFISFLFEILPFKPPLTYEKINVTSVLHLWLMVSIPKLDTNKSFKSQICNGNYKEELVSLFIKKYETFVLYSVDLKLVIALTIYLCKNNQTNTENVLKTILDNISFNEYNSWSIVLEEFLECDDKLKEFKINAFIENPSLFKFRIDSNTRKLTKVCSYLVRLIQRYNNKIKKNENFARVLNDMKQAIEDKLKMNNSVNKLLDLSLKELLQMKNNHQLSQITSPLLFSIYIDVLTLIDTEIKNGNCHFILKDYGMNKIQLVYMKALIKHCQKELDYRNRPPPPNLQQPTHPLEPIPFLM